MVVAPMVQSLLCYSHSYGTVTHSYGTVTHSYGTVTHSYGTVTHTYGTVTHSYGTVTQVTVTHYKVHSHINHNFSVC